MQRLTSISLFALAAALSACAGGNDASTRPATPAPAATTAAFGREFHRAFRRHFKAPFLVSCTRSAAASYCGCVERGYERAFTDEELTALGNGTASSAVREKSARIIRNCPPRSRSVRR